MQPLAIARIEGKPLAVFQPRNGEIPAKAPEMHFQFAVRYMPSLDVSTVRAKCPRDIGRRITAIHQVAEPMHIGRLGILRDKNEKFPRGQGGRKIAGTSMAEFRGWNAFHSDSTLTR